MNIKSIELSKHSAKVTVARLVLTDDVALEHFDEKKFHLREIARPMLTRQPQLGPALTWRRANEAHQRTFYGGMDSSRFENSTV